MQVVIIIPALNPDTRLVDYCRALRDATDSPILLIDDGSRDDCRTIFKKCLAVGKDISVVRHDVNMGKGRALKTAFAHLLEKHDDMIGCVTCDSDGQHSVPDVIRCIEELKRSPKSLILGCRRFDGDDVPWKSRFGNNWMRFLFLIVSGYRFQDTQTGLRAIPIAFMRELLEVPGDRFEFESEMLLRLRGRSLVQIPIRTIYDEQNKGTHFRPVTDSFRVVGVVLRYGARRFGIFALASFASFCVDIGLFHLFHLFAVRHEMPGRLFFPVGAARCISLVFNYLCNRHLAFHSEGSRSLIGGRALGKYLILAGCLLTASYLLTKTVAFWLPGKSVTLIKAGVDFFLFLASYTVQRTLIFKPGCN